MTAVGTSLHFCLPGGRARASEPIASRGRRGSRQSLSQPRGLSTSSCQPMRSRHVASVGQARPHLGQTSKFFRASSRPASTIPRAKFQQIEQKETDDQDAEISASDDADIDEPGEDAQDDRGLEVLGFRAPTNGSSNGSVPAGCIAAISEGFHSIEEAVEAIRQGKMVVVVDDEDRENEGDLILAGAMASPSALAFMLRHCSGLICCGASPAVLDRLQLPLMVPPRSNSDAYRTAFTLSVDVLEGCVTGMSATERASTIRALASPTSLPTSFRRPGHIFPLRARPGGVLQRAGHTEAAVDLAVLAGLPPVGVLCEVVNPDGSMARLPQLRTLVAAHDLCLISIAGLIRYRLQREKVVEREVTGKLPLSLEQGNFEAQSYRSLLDGAHHLAIRLGHVEGEEKVPVHVLRECVAGDAFGAASSASCQCREDLEGALQDLQLRGRGVLVCLRGRDGDSLQGGASHATPGGENALEGGGVSMERRTCAVLAQILDDTKVRSVEWLGGDFPVHELEAYLDAYREHSLSAPTIASL